MAKEYSRPNPDELLIQFKAKEEQRKRGKLKIFLGYAAGVGKTYAMLQAAHQLKKELDVVVAVVETHGRLETKVILKGLEFVPQKQVAYHGITIAEMDLDAVLARHPQLALVDELAHTNTPGLFHPKRYQDIEELLEAGIDIYTTLNVQNIESLRNSVAQITGVWRRLEVLEGVPDSIIDNAEEIELIDLPPDELLKRFKEGKVYVPEQIAYAIDKFFRKGNLTALRELTMRTAAKHIDEKTRAYMKTEGIDRPLLSAERLLVCISPNHVGYFLVRNARRLAYQLNAEWFAVYVETPDNARPSRERQEYLMNTFRLAEKLGAKVITIQGNSVDTALIEFATKNNITKIVVGKSLRNWLRNPLHRSVVNQIIRHSEPFDVYVVSGTRNLMKQGQDKIPEIELIRKWRDYLQCLGLVVLATLLGHFIHSFFDPTNIIMVYLLCVAISAFSWGLGPSIFISILSVVAFDIFFVPPTLTFNVKDSQYIFTFIALLVVGIIISYLASRIRWQTEAARQRERETTALYTLGRDLAISKDLNSYIHVITERIKEALGYDVVIFLADIKKEGTLKKYEGDVNVIVDENELAAAVWSFQHQRAVGRGTDTLPNAEARYLPLVTIRGAIGVMSLWATETAIKLTIEQERLLGAYADLIAITIESILLTEKAFDTELLRATERLQTALLNAISHDLRTPLTSIMGALSSLQEEGMGLDDVAKTSLLQLAREETDRLNQLITNLLAESRIEAGAITLSRQPYEIQDLVSAALEQLHSHVKVRSIIIDLSPEMPLISVDFGLIVQTLVNILDNALKYSPPDSPIEIKGRHITQEVHIEIADHGVGIPSQDLLQVFDKFYRIKHPDNVVGTGLGLSICKGIIEAHGGRIIAENRPGGGTVIKMILPVDESNPNV